MSRFRLFKPAVSTYATVMKAFLAALALTVCATAAINAQDFEFVVIGDTRPRFETENFRPFESLITRINALHPRLVINLGDLIYGYGPRSKERQWDKYQGVLKELHVPYYQVPGNHDTHSKEARRIYGRRFGKFYDSFDYGGCHFVLLDNTEHEHWGYIGPAQLEWLRNDLRQTRAEAVFVFMHFPVWEPERITPAYYQFWSDTLHPLFRQSRVRGVFAGHYHAYGPTREFDGIRYFITGGGGAELRPEYIRSGGVHHFMKIKVSGADFSVRVVTERGEMSDPEADVMGALQFAARNISRIGLRRDARDLQAGVTFGVSVRNPYSESLLGKADWVMDPSAFSVEPPTIALQLPPGASNRFEFTLKALHPTAALQSLPRLEFNLAAGARHRRFHREVRFLEQAAAPFSRHPPQLDAELEDWTGSTPLRLGGGAEPEAELRSRYDSENLYLAVTAPNVDTDEAEELGVTDSLQLGLARPLSDSDFSGDFLRLGFSPGQPGVHDRTPGHKVALTVPGVKSVSRAYGARLVHEIAIPLRLLKSPRAKTVDRLILDLSFPVPEPGPEAADNPAPGVNTFSYRVRYGSDSLVPVYFIELKLQKPM